jgi:ADP-ribose pyrophosphatase YjhB (NUDIX family)
MVTKNKERVRVTSCGAVTWRATEAGPAILLIQQFKGRDRWGIPKGHVNPGEAFEDTARREVKEETGVLIELGQALPPVTFTSRHEVKTVMSWLARPVGDHEPKHDDPDNEVADARWFPISQLPEIVSYQRTLIAGALRLLG